MKKFLKITGLILVVLIALIAVAGTVVYFKSNGRMTRLYAIKPETVAVSSDPEIIARGRHLATSRGCIDCHGTDFGGAKVVDDPAMGKLHGSNLTSGRGGVVQGFTPTDWARAIRNGVGRDGRGLFLMPSTDYAEFTTDDMAALISFLQTLPAVDRETVPVALGPVARVLMVAGKIKLSAEVINHEQLEPAVVTPGVSVAYGRYLAAGCTGCHGNNFSGGKIDIGPPDWPQAANLTPHATGQLRSWSEADFVKSIREARRPDGTEVNPVMPRTFANLNDTELKALWAYLQTLPAVEKGRR